MKNIAFNVEGYIKVPDNATIKGSELLLYIWFRRYLLL